ncbi:MAG: EVE domain-containing protein [Planctomycetota bacterium]
MAKRYWLFKSEPDVFSIHDLAKAKGKRTEWEGVRNYQARNLLRDEIQKGDEVLYYHSRHNPMAVVGTARVAKAGYPDPYQFDKNSKYFDEKSGKDNPRWFLVDITLGSIFKREVTLKEIKSTAALSKMVLVTHGRLSVQPVTAKEFQTIVKLGAKS